MSEHETTAPDPSGDDGPKLGRPLGSGGPTPEITQTVVGMILAGATDYIAAEAAGISARCFREWMARGEDRHPTRAWTPAHGEFAAAVRQAQAQARVAREVEVARIDPKHWLRNQARSKPGRPGWTEPVPDEQDKPPPTGPLSTSLATPEDAAATLNILFAAGAYDHHDPPGDAYDHQDPSHKGEGK